MTTIDPATVVKRELEQPTPEVADNLWLIVVVAFAVVLLGTAAAVITLSFSQPNTQFVKPELVLSLFTSAAGFLAGLFVPSPKRSEKSS